MILALRWDISDLQGALGWVSFGFCPSLATGSFFLVSCTFSIPILLLCFCPSSLPACVLGHSICIIEDMVMELSYHDVR